MSKCSEFAVFKVPKKNKARVIELSLSIFKEMNSNGAVIIAHEILQKTDDENELCWHLTWVSEKAAKETTAKWPSFPSTKEFQSLVGDNVYYGHFIGALYT
ncbi:hypothetical protein PA25_14670 [Pseudoalteromonas sp. A25]|uniref:hypothetical protein n=1 Tax=Pseudoalteromonas sp. A25 TaxID=116092 RepID=UPI001260B804|nr:hypothetical protein [Pseudoalteromonas sp. A25]BBN81482.1 hypothetical protein PA25_14670 [Pseudoalteromonas sp. A25]